MADLLARQSVIAWARGRAEIGPRALGDRSVLAAPFDPAIVLPAASRAT